MVAILVFPIAIGIIGGLFGLVVGIIGAVFGAFFGIIGGIFGAIFGFFGWIFDGLFNWRWPFGDWGFFHCNIFTIAAVVLVVALIVRSKTNR